MKFRKLATGFVTLALVSAVASGPAIAQQPVAAPVTKKYTTLVLNQGVPKIDVLTTMVGQDIESIVIFSAPLTTKAGKSAGNVAGFLTDLEIGATGSEIRFRNISFMLKGGQIIANGTGEYESTDRELPCIFGPKNGRTGAPGAPARAPAPEGACLCVGASHLRAHDELLRFPRDVPVSARVWAVDGAVCVISACVVCDWILIIIYFYGMIYY